MYSKLKNINKGFLDITIPGYCAHTHCVCDKKGHGCVQMDITVQKHFVYILQLAVHTLQRNWISRLGRYLMVPTQLALLSRFNPVGSVPCATVGQYEKYIF